MYETIASPHHIPTLHPYNTPMHICSIQLSAIALRSLLQTFIGCAVVAQTKRNVVTQLIDHFASPQNCVNFWIRYPRLGLSSLWYFFFVHLSLRIYIQVEATIEAAMLARFYPSNFFASGEHSHARPGSIYIEDHNMLHRIVSARSVPLGRAHKSTGL